MDVDLFIQALIMVIEEIAQEGKEEKLKELNGSGDPTGLTPARLEKAGDADKEAL
jgi:hypothetical protein